FAVRAAFGDQRCDAALGSGQAPLAGAPADATQFRARLRGPADGPDRLEPVERRLDRLARLALPAGAALDDSEREQRPRTAKGVAYRLVLGDRPIEQQQRLLEIAASRGDQAAAAAHLGEHTLTFEACRVRLPSVEQLDGVGGPPDLQQDLG